jgi:PAS domain S-box-containing protein
VTREKAAQDAHRESENRYLNLCENVPIGFYRTTPEGHILWTNSALLRMLGYSSLEELRQRNLEKAGFEPSYSRAEFKERLAREGQVIGLEATWIRSDGTRITVRENCHAICDASGKIQYYDGTAEDITERRLAEEALRESDEKYRALFDNERTAIGIIDLDTKRFADVNDAHVRLYGYSREELLGDMNIFDVSAEREDSSLSIQSAYEKGTIFVPLRWHKKKDGTVFPVEIVGGPYQWKGRRMVFAMVFDISERKQAEEALRQNESKWRSYIENSPVGILVSNASGQHVEANPCVEEMLGYPPGGLLQTSIMDLPAEEMIEAAKQHLAEVKSKGQADGQFLLRRKDGRKIWASIRASSLPGGRFMTVLQDITEQKQAAEEKVRLETQLQQAQRMESVGRLAGGVAHDFNNMLGVILGHTELALEQVGAAQPLYDDLKEVQKAAQRSADLTRQLLAFARKQTVAPRIIDLNQTVAGMINMLRKLIGEDIKLHWHPAEPLWPVKIDPGQIDQIMANLCVNARDAIAGVGNVSVEMTNCKLDKNYCAVHEGAVPGEYVRLAVSDDGCGMDKNTLSHTFEPFFTTKGVGHGTGLGLATIYGIVKQNHGFIDVYSEPEKGATFTIYLPRHMSEADQAAGMEGVAQPAKRGHETILLVEDEPSLLKLTKRTLEKQGYAVLATSSPGEAIRLAKECSGDVHLLVTDVVMPEMNGRDLAKNLRSLYPHIKHLFTSGYTADVIAHHGVLDEGIHFIQKPFAPNSLTNKIREVLDQS